MKDRNKKYMYGVYKNADMTEGRGPMIPVAFFTTTELAMDFCESKRGIMGREAPSGNWAKEKYGDWEVRPILLCDSLEAVEEVAKRKKELRETIDKAQAELDSLNRCFYRE